MGDIDFDELDKAVNSLMGKVGDKTLEDQDKLNTLAIKDTLKPDEKPKYDTLGKAAQGIGDETLEDGQREILENLEAPQPPTDAPKVVALDSVKVAEVPKAPEETPKAPASPAVKKPKSGRFMDMMPQADKRTAPATPDLVVPARHTPTPPVAAPASPPGPSPFLTDAKVEKRPLGGEAPTGSLITDTSEDAAEAVVETESVNSEEKKLDNGSGDEQRTLDASGFDEEAAAQEQKLQAIEAVEAKETVAESIIAVESGDTEKLLNKSISGSDENTSGNIYDVNNLHQPLGHPAKQKSGWGIVFVILIIIVLAAALAGAAYFILVKP